MSANTQSSSEADRCSRLRAEIMLVVKANGVPKSDEIYLALLFRSESELRAIAQELHITNV